MKTIISFILLALFIFESNAQQTLKPNDFKIGMIGFDQDFIRTPDCGSANSPLKFITNTLNTAGYPSSHLNQLGIDGFNIVQNQKPDDIWNNGDTLFRSYLHLIKNNSMQAVVSADNWYRPVTPCNNALLGTNVYYDEYDDLNGGTTKNVPWFNCKIRPHFASSTPSESSIMKVCALTNPNLKNVVWGWHLVAEGNSLHKFNVSTTDKDTSGSCNVELPPSKVNEAIGFFRNKLQTEGVLPGQQKMIVAAANHQHSINANTLDGETGIYNPQDYLSFSNKPDVLFEASYYSFGPTDWAARPYSQIYNSGPANDGPNANRHYLAKFKNIDYFKNFSNNVHAEISCDLAYGALGNDYKYNHHTNNNIPNANFLWSQAYMSIIHGVKGIWLWGLTLSYDINDPADVSNQNYVSFPTNTDRFRLITPGQPDYYSNYYKMYTRFLAQELRYLYQKNFLSTDENTILYTKVDQVDPNCNIVPSCTTYIPATYTVYPSPTVYTLPAEKKSENYGLRYTIRTNGKEVIMVISNPLPVAVTTTLNFSNVANPVIRNATGVNALFEQYFPDYSIVTSPTYKTNRTNSGINWSSGTVNWQPYRAFTGNKQLPISFGPMDTHVLKFSSTVPTSSNGWTNVWSNFGTGMINLNWVQATDQFIPGDFDGDGTDELLCIQRSNNNAWATMLKYKNVGGGVYDWQWEWSNYGNGSIGGHGIQAADKYIVGDFNGDGREELLCIQNNGTTGVNEWAAKVTYMGASGWNFDWTNGGNDLIGGWGIQSGDIFIAGDFWGDSKKELLCIQNNGSTGVNEWAAIKNFDTIVNDWQWGCDNGQNGFIGNWEIKSSDEYKVGDLNGDGKKDDLLCVQKGGYYGGIYKNFSASGNCAWNWTQLWNNGGVGGIGGVGNPVNVDDKILIGNIDSDNKEEMMFINTCAGCNYAVTEELNSSNQPTWRWSNQNPRASNYLYDWPIYDASGSDVNYLFIKPNLTDTKYLMAFRKYGCSDYLVNMYKPTGVNYKEEAATAGNEYISKQHIINIFPNPSKGEFTIDISPLSDSNYKIEICNIYGQLVKTIASKAGNNNPYVQVDLTDVSSGVYFVKIISDSITETSRITINR